MSTPAAPSTVPVPAPSAPDGELWITLASASRALGVHVGAVKSLALGGALRHRTLPGLRTRYYRPDVLKLLSAAQ